MNAAANIVFIREGFRNLSHGNPPVRAPTVDIFQKPNRNFLTKFLTKNTVFGQFFNSFFLTGKGAIPLPHVNRLYLVRKLTKKGGIPSTIYY